MDAGQGQVKEKWTFIMQRNMGLSWQMNISKTQAMAEGQYCFSSGSSTESPTILVGPEGKFYIWVEL